jgi:hypothetical protein
MHRSQNLISVASFIRNRLGPACADLPGALTYFDLAISLAFETKELELLMESSLREHLL